MKKIYLIIVLGIGVLMVVLLNANNNKNDRESENVYVNEYDEKILDDIYINNEALKLLNFGRNINQVIDMYPPSISMEDREEYYYNIKNGKQLKITVYEDGRIRGMYYDNKERISNKLYKKICKCKNIEGLKKYVENVHIFYKDAKILNEQQEELEAPFCEICFDNYDTCKIIIDSKGNIQDFHYIESRK